MSQDEVICPDCGQPIPGGAPAGMCPHCLLLGGASTAYGSGRSGGRQIPDLREVQEKIADYELIEVLGAGGMGTVFKARQKRLDRLVAVKVLSPDTASDPEFPARFQREAMALAKLNHPNIVTIFDLGQAGGIFYLAMEWVDGLTLAELIKSGDVKPSEALSIVPQICDALQYAHDQGIVHRDIKPGNILIDRSGNVKVADFGLVKLMAAEEDDLFLTFANQNVGTPLYMAPEQRENPMEVDHRADIYSLGVVFYELLTGTLPTGRFSPPSQKVQVDGRVDEVVLRALDADPTRRYQAASELRTGIQQCGGPAPAPVPCLEPAVRKSWIVFGVAGAAAVLIGILGMLFWPNTPTASTEVWKHPGPAGRLLGLGTNLAGELDEIPGNGDFVAVTADGVGGMHALALRADGSVIAWGRNDYGQCDIPPGLKKVTAIAQGQFHSLALRGDGTVIAWGRNGDGQIDVPLGLRDVVAITAANRHSAALTANGEVVVWGADYGGKLTHARAGEKVVKIEAGEYHLAGITETGKVLAWGDNIYKACDVPEGAQANVVDVAAGRHWNVAARADGSLVFWGHDANATSEAPFEDRIRRVFATGFTGAAITFDGKVRCWGELAFADHPRTGNAIGIATGWNHIFVIEEGSNGQRIPEPLAAPVPLLKTFAQHTDPIFDIVVSPDSNRAATVSGKALRVYDLGSERLLRTLEHPEPLWGADAIEDGTIACAATDRVMLANIDDRDGWRAECRIADRQPDEAVTAVAIGKDGNALVAGTSGGRIVVWKKDEKDALIHVVTTDAHDSTVSDLCFDDDQFYSVGWDGSADKGAYCWRVPERAGEPLERTLVIPGWRWRIQTLARSSAGLVAFGDWDGKVTLWDSVARRYRGWIRTNDSSKHDVTQWLGEADSVSVRGAFTPDGKHLITGGADRAIRIWRISSDSNAVLTRVAELPDQTDHIRALAVTPDGSYLVSSGHGNCLRLWDLGALRR